MASGSAGSRIASAVFLAFGGFIAWVIAPMFAPMYRWIEVDFAAMASSSGYSVDELHSKENYFFYYNPRGQGDPLPWQLMIGSNYESPSWAVDPVSERQVDEYNMLVRVAVLSDRTGEMPSTMMKGSAYYDNVFRADAWRLPAGSLGQHHTRPVLLIDSSSWNKLSIGEAKPLVQQLKLDLRKGDWISDDDPEQGFPWRADNFDPEAAAREPEATAEVPE